MDSTPLDFDFPCAHCGYNLRGLGGERVRCPECGSEHAREMIRAVRERRKAAEWEEHIAKVSFGANICAAATAGASLGLIASFTAAWPAVRLFVLGCFLLWALGLL